MKTSHVKTSLELWIQWQKSKSKRKCLFCISSIRDWSQNSRRTKSVPIHRKDVNWVFAEILWFVVEKCRNGPLETAFSLKTTNKHEPSNLDELCCSFTLATPQYHVLQCAFILVLNCCANERQHRFALMSVGSFVGNDVIILTRIAFCVSRVQTANQIFHIEMSIFNAVWAFDLIFRNSERATGMGGRR